MTTDKKVARRKLSLLELASDLGNVRKACRVIGYSRQHFYEIRRNFQTYSAEGLLDRLPRRQGAAPELFLQLEDEHKRTRVNRPQSKRHHERWHRTLLDEHFRVEGRRTWFETLEEMQTVLDQYLIEYNTKRPHQGRGMNGHTPITAFIDGIRKENTPQPNSIQKAPNRRPERRLLSADYPLCTSSARARDGWGYCT